MSFSPHSKVWIYSSTKEIGQIDVMAISQELKHFVHGWTSHGKDVVSGFKIICNRFIAIIVDEERSGISGCGIDKSVKELERIGQKLNYDFFDRSLFYLTGDKQVVATSTNDLAVLYQNKNIDDQTLFFDTLVKDLESLEKHFLVPLKSSWHFRFV